MLFIKLVDQAEKSAPATGEIKIGDKVSSVVTGEYCGVVESIGVRNDEKWYILSHSSNSFDCPLVSASEIFLPAKTFTFHLNHKYVISGDRYVRVVQSPLPDEAAVLIDDNTGKIICRLKAYKVSYAGLAACGIHSIV